jgi:hypothetical protein
MRKFLEALLPAAFGCIVMVIILKIMTSIYMHFSLGQFYILIANIVFGAIVYLGMLAFIGNPELKKSLSVLVGMRFKKG